MNPGRIAAKRFATRVLRASGWAFEGEVPTLAKYVAIAYPHTSNWDGLVFVTIATSLALDARWMIKQEWLRGPFGPLLRGLGAIGIDRGAAHSVVATMIDAFAASDRLVLGIPPEGTRRRTERWKSGFYHIAVGAKVPVVPAYIDFARKRVGMGAPIAMTGDVRADMDAIRAFYAAKHPVAFDPARAGVIRLREED